MQILFPEAYFTNNDTFDIYNSSFFYKNYIMQKEYYPYQFDEWYEKKNYGRIDLENNVIYPKNSFLKQYQSSAGIFQKNINFVADAFLDLKNFYEEVSKKDKLVKTSIYSKLISAKSTEDVESLYVEYIKNVYKLFENYFINNDRNTNPHSVNSFIKKFISFLDVYLNFGILNRSSYIKSRNVPGNIDGLRISLESITDTDFKTKANYYINNEQFDSFIKNCGRFGFFVDKNKPWSIVFDLDSPVLKEYSSRYQLYTKQQIYDVCYFKTYKVDLENLNNLLVTFWNNYVIKNSVVYNNIESSVCMKQYQEKIELKQLSQELFEKIFNINWQLRFYLYVKLKEEKISISQQKFEILHIDACKINKIYNSSEAVLYINKKMVELAERQKPTTYSLTTESEFYKLLEQQAKSFKDYDIRF